MENQPVYKRIFNELREKIISGELEAGGRIPSEKELCAAYNVSRITSKRALELLAEQGFISRRPGKGSFVNAVLPGRGEDAASRSIGFILPGFSDFFGTGLFYGIEEACSDLGYRLVLKRTRDDAGEEERAISAMSGMAGILMLPIHGEFYNSEILKLILEKRAIVFVDRKMRGLAAPAISSDNLEGAEKGTKYLLNLGHRNIAFFSGPISHTSTVEDRYQGFIRAFAELKAGYNGEFCCQKLSSTWNWPFHAPEKVAADVEIVRAHLEAYPEISAAFAAEYTLAAIVGAAVRALGRRIPDDFSLLSFDAPPQIAEPPQVTHIRQDDYAMGKLAVETLHRVISGEDPSSIRDVIIPTTLIPGLSTARYKKY
jgi:DNA-binding LacI/PurR family transcriptional regulator